MKQRSPWAWVPSVSFGQGVPYVAVMMLSTVMYKNLGISNADLAFYTAWLYLPWVVKPLWSPIVEMFGTKRRWTVLMQLVGGAGLAAVALTLHAPEFFRWTLVIFWLMAFSSATHDIASDGFYMLGLPTQHQQAAFVGVRSAFYKLAMIGGQGGLVYIAGELIKASGDPARAWSVVFALMAGLYLALCAYHQFVLPRPDVDRSHASGGALWRDFVHTFRSFFQKPGIIPTLGFLLLYRLGEAQLLKMAAPFLLDPRDKGGLGLSTSDFGLVYGTIGVCALVIGGLAGGVTVSRFGLKRALLPMVFIMHVPDLVFVYLATALPDHLVLISACLAVEQFGYGFGFAAFLLYMVLVADGEHKTAHYAICTGFMALGMMLPGMVSGWIQQALGYQQFFIWACISTLPAFVMTLLVRIPAEFGRK
ncbi:MFS transporter, PAT family, beta-lactamase induction signal transducer AmpG [Duganella sp. CF402]|uniref:MFS transporter n=1 Tax=unclassified Duganella TaxID=2636909 RepID=UPI0008C24756|nr:MULTISPECIES: MFS transporter [unclassified Duganella]RZT05541.1 PAT family beta-lactamase induction signal transducer AmpG [Duganella sp. BK701]SEN00298.1 MFS transporter, PAT family, beta-lactamase induction signal transducer AmpG [Duganella sp. CF402]